LECREIDKRIVIMKSESGKTALITGASSGIGKEFARIHARKGGNLVLVARNKEGLESLKRELEATNSVTVYTISKDLLLPSAPQEIFDELTDKKIQIDYLINDAGFGGLGKFHERQWSQDLDMIQLNVIALASLTHLFLPGFVKRNEGKILNVSSTASLMPGPLQAVYYATKAFVTSFGNALAEELSDTNITVTTLMPGATSTGFGKISGMDKTVLFNKTASADTVAKDGYEAMLKGKLNVISGITFSQRLLFVLLPIIPKKLLLHFIRKMQETK
jgi:short-subunit dehydrogenase